MSQKYRQNCHIIPNIHICPSESLSLMILPAFTDTGSINSLGLCRKTIVFTDFDCIENATSIVVGIPLVISTAKCKSYTIDMSVINNNNLYDFIQVEMGG